MTQLLALNATSNFFIILWSVPYSFSKQWINDHNFPFHIHQNVHDALAHSSKSTQIQSPKHMGKMVNGGFIFTSSKNNKPRWMKVVDVSVKGDSMPGQAQEWQDLLTSLAFAWLIIVVYCIGDKRKEPWMGQMFLFLLLFPSLFIKAVLIIWDKEKKTKYLNVFEMDTCL